MALRPVNIAVTSLSLGSWWASTRALSHYDGQTVVGDAVPPALFLMAPFVFALVALSALFTRMSIRPKPQAVMDAVR